MFQTLLMIRLAKEGYRQNREPEAECQRLLNIQNPFNLLTVGGVFIYESSPSEGMVDTSI